MDTARGMTKEILLLARLGGQRIAFQAAVVDAVVEIDNVAPVPLAPPHVLGLSAIRSHVVTVIDCGIAVTNEPSGATGRAVLTTIDGNRYALRLDAVEDVGQHQILPGAGEFPLGSGWGEIAVGRVDLGDGFALVVDPARLVAPQAQRVAA